MLFVLLYCYFLFEKRLIVEQILKIKILRPCLIILVQQMKSQPAHSRLTSKQANLIFFILFTQPHFGASQSYTQRCVNAQKMTTIIHFAFIWNFLFPVFFFYKCQVCQQGYMNEISKTWSIYVPLLSEGFRLS